MFLHKMNKIPSLIVLVSLIIGGCSSPTSTISVPNAMEMIPSLETTPVTISTKLPVTSSPYPIPSKTVIPTLPPAQKMTEVAKLLTQDYHCSLPCWGGIEPGRSNLSEASDIWEKYADGLLRDSGELTFNNKRVTFWFLTNSHNIIEFLGVPRYEYPVHHLLREHGKPDEIYFYITNVLPVDTTNPYLVFLFYKEGGIIAEYFGETDRGLMLNICDKDMAKWNGQMKLWLWMKGSHKSFLEITDDMDRFSEYSFNYKKLSELSDYSIDDFVAIFDTPKSCIQVKDPNQ